MELQSTTRHWTPITPRLVLASWLKALAVTGGQGEEGKGEAGEEGVSALLSL
jgi:hypothetical protein